MDQGFKITGIPFVKAVAKEGFDIPISVDMWFTLKNHQDKDKRFLGVVGSINNAIKESRVDF